jgi:hypothetical protein
VNIAADSPSECVTLDCDRAYLVEADKPVVRNARIRVIGHLVDPVTTPRPGGQDLGGDEHVPGGELLRVWDAAVQHCVRLACGRGHFPEQDVHFSVRLVTLGAAGLAHLLHGSRLKCERQPGRHFLVVPAPLLPGHHVPVYDLQVTADILVDVEERLPGNRLVLEIVPGGGHRVASSSAITPPVVRGSRSVRALRPAVAVCLRDTSAIQARRQAGTTSPYNCSLTFGLPRRQSPGSRHRRD